MNNNQTFREVREFIISSGRHVCSGVVSTAYERWGREVVIDAATLIVSTTDVNWIALAAKEFITGSTPCGCCE